MSDDPIAVPGGNGGGIVNAGGGSGGGGTTTIPNQTTPLGSSLVGNPGGLETVETEETPMGALELDDGAIPQGAIGVPKTGGEGPIDGAVTELTGMGMVLSVEMMAILAFVQKKKKREEENA
jgi:hypothetical protein